MDKRLLLYVPLFVIIVLNFFNAIFIDVAGSVNVLDSISTELIVNGSTTVIYIDSSSTFNFDALLGAITWIIVCTTLAGILGIRVVGSGFADFSIKTILIDTALITSYIFFGLTAFPFIQAIPSFFGEAIFIFLSVCYTFGVFDYLSGGT